MVIPVLAWAGTYLLHSALLLLAAEALDRWMPAGRDHVRETAWRGAVLLPLLSVSLPRIAMLRGPAQNSVGLAAGGATPSLVLSSAMSWTTPVMFVWALVSLILVTRLVAGYLHLRRAAGHLRMPTADETDRIRAAAPDAWPKVRLAEGVLSPTTFHAQIWIHPAMVAALTPGELKAVLAHETAHLARRDPAWRWIVALVSRILVFQPLLWRAEARLRELSECLCDARAVREGASGLDLASALGKVARWLNEPPVSHVAALVGDESLTLRRVRRLLGGNGEPDPAPPPALRAVLLAGVTLTMCAAAPGVRGLDHYTVFGRDPAGSFTVTIEGSRVVAASLGGKTLAAADIEQRGGSVRLRSGDSPPLDLRLAPEQRGLRWAPRPPPFSR
ncbi:MAG TPA: M56 family metallopeptidase [Longimicrobium sp.]|jgi:Zn-dependent protease with chaperone function|uniref:M56 family metallopeptidase n=1 Tax=Longimicrobium sp. TaxID=2029185 RepID=UPI002ED8D346